MAFSVKYRVGGIAAILSGMLLLPLALLELLGVFLDAATDNFAGAFVSNVGYAVLALIEIYALVCLARILKPFGFSWVAYTLVGMLAASVPLLLFSALTPQYELLNAIVMGLFGLAYSAFLLLLAIVIIKDRQPGLAALHRYGISQVIAAVLFLSILLWPLAVLAQMLANFLLGGALFRIAREAGPR